jgi:hypothetical protein
MAGDGRIHPPDSRRQGADTQVLMGAFFEIVLVIALIGTAVALYPIVTRQNDGVALGYVRGRLPEAAVIVVGIVSVVSVVTLRKAVAGAAGTDAGLLVTVGKSLVAIHDWTFLFGRGLVLGANTVLLAHLASIHQVSRPVPHRGPPRTAKQVRVGPVGDTDPLA